MQRPLIAGNIQPEAAPSLTVAFPRTAEFDDTLAQLPTRAERGVQFDWTLSDFRWAGRALIAGALLQNPSRENRKAIRRLSTGAPVYERDRTGRLRLHNTITRQLPGLDSNISDADRLTCSAAETGALLLGTADAITALRRRTSPGKSRIAYRFSDPDDVVVLGVHATGLELECFDPELNGHYGTGLTTLALSPNAYQKRVLHVGIGAADSQTNILVAGDELSYPSRSDGERHYETERVLARVPGIIRDIDTTVAAFPNRR